MINLGKESEKVEFKKTTSELNEGLISIVAILNKSGQGKLYFGVKNNGDAIGQEISESTLRDISRKIYEGIKPTIYPSISLLKENNNVIEVSFLGNDRPYSYKGKFYIRIFDEDRQLDIKELSKMINFTDSSNILWEKEASNENINDIDEEELKNYFNKCNECGRIEEKYNNKIESLKKLKLLLSDDYTLNNAGKVLFSKNKPVSLKLATFTSDEKLSFVDINKVDGNIFELIAKGINYIKEHINFNASILKEKRVEESEIPLEAIREVVLNSFCHSSFSSQINNEIYITPSRVVIFNPGNFPAGYEPEDFAYNGALSILRNPIIANVLYYSHDIDTWASGFRRAFKLCKMNNIQYFYRKVNNGFEFTFYRKNIQSIPLEEFILSLIKDNPNITIGKLSEFTSKSKRTIQDILSKLKREYKIERKGSNKTGYWRVLSKY